MYGFMASVIVPMARIARYTLFMVRTSIRPGQLASAVLHRDSAAVKEGSSCHERSSEAVGAFAVHAGCMGRDS